MEPSPPPREQERCARLSDWAASSGVDLATLDEGQRWVLYAALSFLGFIGGFSALRRMVAYFLSHCGMGLSSTAIGAVVGTTDRAVRKGRTYAPAEFWKRLKSSRRGHPVPKLRRDQVGLVAKFLAEHKRCSVAEVLGFIQQSLGVEMDRLTLRRFLKRYGLGCLREEKVEDAPLLSAPPRTAAPSP